MSTVAANTEEKTGGLKHAFTSRQALVHYLEAPLLDGDKDTAENRRVGLAN